MCWGDRTGSHFRAPSDVEAYGEDFATRFSQNIAVRRLYFALFLTWV
jgi:hypothetical protein